MSHSTRAILVLCLVLMVTLLVAERGAADYANLTTVLLTDRSVTEGDSVLPTIVAGKWGAHVVWSEYLVYDPEHAVIDSELFYVRLPAGIVHRLSTIPGSIYYYQMVSDSHDRAVIIWAEDTGTQEGTDLYFWRSGMRTPIRLSDHQRTDGRVGDSYLLLDGHDSAHVLWAEATLAPVADPEIFYWTEGGSVTQLSVGDFTLGSFNVTGVDALLEGGGVVHALWHDLETTTSGGVEPYYWNSERRVVTRLRPPGVNGSDPLVYARFLNQDGVVHVLWHDQLPHVTQLLHWDSAEMTNHLIAPGGWLGASMAQDGSGNAHVMWQGGTTLYHWDSANRSSQPVGRAATDLPPRTDDSSAPGRIHVAWRGPDDAWPEHENDAFYWQPGMAQPLNVTDHTRPAAAASDLRLVTDETDTAHLMWQEGETFSYFDSLHRQTVALTGTVSLDYQPHRCQINRADLGQVFCAQAGVAYVLTRANPNTTAPLYVWQSDTATYTPVPAVYGPIRADAAVLWLDSNRQVHVIWQDESLPGEESNLHYWNAVDGSRDLSDLDETTGEVYWEAGLADDAGRIYVFWSEMSEQPEGEDLFAAFEPVDYSNLVFLPLAVR